MIYKLSQKVSDILIKPFGCLSCGDKFRLDEIVFSFQDETCTPILKGWFCNECIIKQKWSWGSDNIINVS